jgi:hypothetical protein
MITLKHSIIWGSILTEIMVSLDQIEELYLGIFIHSLKYDDEKKGIEEKTKFLASLKSQVDKINKGC